MILLYHIFDNKGRRRKRGNLQIKKKQKKKKLKSRVTHNHKLTKFHEKLKRIETGQYIEIRESKKHVLITSK